MNILSIDFDYFQRVSAEFILMNYPDGVDVIPELSTIIWAMHITQNPATEGVSLRKSDYDDVTKLLTAQKPHAVYVGLSHAGIVPFIEKYCNKNDAIHISHIDMHHDAFTATGPVDCGNWASYVSREYKKARLTWVPAPASEKAYEKGKVSFPKKQLTEEVSGKQYDLIFLCRSDSWLPPHLDKEFCKMATILLDTAKISGATCFTDEGVLVPRDYKPFARQYSAMMQNTMKSYEVER